jgi:hypothetical protein
MYIERYTPETAGSAAFSLPASQAVSDLVSAALTISKLQEFTGRTEPTVIT